MCVCVYVCVCVCVGGGGNMKVLYDETFTNTACVPTSTILWTDIKRLIYAAGSKQVRYSKQCRMQIATSYFILD